MRHDEETGVMLAFHGAAVFRQTSNSQRIDLRPLAAERMGEYEGERERDSMRERERKKVTERDRDIR